MTEQMQEAKATPAAQKAKAKSHPSNTIQTSSEIISVDEPENALPEVSLADLPQLLQTACAKAGWNSLMPVQSRALPYLLEGRDLMVQSRTGSGKTGTYLLPLMARLNPAMPAVQALILVPTRELAVQVEQEAKTLFKGSGFTVAAVYGGVGYGKQMDALRQGVSVVVGTPGRVLDHLLRRTLNLDHISALIFDEADRMLSIGFYPDMKEIQRYLPETSIHAMLFSATYPPHVLKLAGEFLTDPQMLSLSTTQIHVAEVQHLYCECKSMEKDRTLIKILEVENPASAIIFCNTKATVHFVTAVLQGFGFNADELSADLSQSRREDVLSRLRKGTIRFLVATDVAARGIDIPELSHVFLYEPPDDRESYIHRAGRTGRAGAAGVVISLVDIMEKMELQRIAKYFKVPLTQHMAPTDEEVAHAVGMRVTALLEARFRQLNGLERERMKRFEPLVQSIAEDPEQRHLLTLLLDDCYQKSLNPTAFLPAGTPRKESEGAARPPKPHTGGGRRGPRENGPRREGGRREGQPFSKEGKREGGRGFKGRKRSSDKPSD
ncbi:DEAD/DEAH box helicase [Bilophila wadsworthia]|jgi:ATP-dependent RNA helicase DeaD|uniref:RNA helicase n=9 Tax=Bilophila wadsworthia TaxID=35833 RepID=E5Y5R6_BILW3|nr:DEAD/DEAH box helicase [Bilophila wadsworthia]MDR3813910.1 DEAD/DEAH box helicase [Bilophila sp.]EFV44628.1 ATP-dependent RNA helicase DeaD [Bilophila wadsworthia 3_1_6]MBS5374120.1 DEAD/DEAH box helicase [Bilophila wadsworthia]MCB8569778.1 DEAD/DEAH box helicase [Bilophila wadsworthia]MCC2713739.1 DEAD/DEAH box helicase [Bilophila wadsworthia]